MNQGKQTVAELAFTHKDWTRQLPEGFQVELRMDSKTQKEHVGESGQVTVCSDLQWWLGGHSVAEGYGPALKMTGPDGAEVKGVFKNFRV